MKSLIRWDPFRMMRRWEPFEELGTMQSEMDDLFSRLIGTRTESNAPMRWLPLIDSYVKDDKLIFKAELPGIDPKDIDVSITDRELIIKGERKQEKDEREENYVYREIAYGSFERHFALPEGIKIDELKAKFVNGILEVTVPAPVIAKARKIEIETTRDDKKSITGEVKKAA